MQSSTESPKAEAADEAQCNKCRRPAEEGGFPVLSSKAAMEAGDERATRVEIGGDSQGTQQSPHSL